MFDGGLDGLRTRWGIYRGFTATRTPTQAPASYPFAGAWTAREPQSKAPWTTEPTSSREWGPLIGSSLFPSLLHKALQPCDRGDPGRKVSAAPSTRRPPDPVRGRSVPSRTMLRAGTSRDEQLAGRCTPTRHPNHRLSKGVPTPSEDASPSPAPSRECRMRASGEALTSFARDERSRPAVTGHRREAWPETTGERFGDQR